MAPHQVSEEDESSRTQSEDNVSVGEYDSASDSATDIELEPENVATSNELSKTKSKLVRSSGEQPSEKQERTLLAYHGLSSRRVDLVGDYAGNELFLIEGDSLLLEAFSDPDLDFDYGFQLVHAVYLVERFLHHLKQRKCNFHVAFFENHKSLCVPHSVTEANLPKYLLARAAIIRHLQANMPESQDRIKVFHSIHGSDFQEYLARVGMYFMMCHDGARPAHITASKAESRKDLDRVSSFRTMILSFISRGYNVALVNGLEWRDTKVMTMVLEKSRRTPKIELKKPSNDSSGNAMSRNLLDEAAVRSLSSQKELSERELLAVASISCMWKGSDRMASSAEELQLAAVSFLLHIVLLKQLSISDRRFAKVEVPKQYTQFLSRFAIAATTIMGSHPWQTIIDDRSGLCDLADAVDGRLFAVVASGIGELPKDIHQSLASLCQAVSRASGEELVIQLPRQTGNGTEATASSSNEPVIDVSVMPFSNPVFDKHLTSIHLNIDENADSYQSGSSARIFREVSHWHNAKRPIIQKGPPVVVSAREESRALRRNQFFMAEMAAYAASLTNAVGKSLDPETIVVGAARPSTLALISGQESASASEAEAKPAKGKGGPDTKKKGGKVAAKNAGKQAMLENIAAANAKKEEAGTAKVIQAWHYTCKNVMADQDLASRYSLLKDYFVALPREKAKVLGAEVQLCMLSVLLEHWIHLCRSEDTKELGIAALIWHTCRTVAGSAGLTKTVCTKLELTLTTLELPQIDVPKATQDRALPFTFTLPTSAKTSLSIDMPPKDFQLLHCGPYLDRSIDSAPDHRVDFEPDGWQKRVLDGIDANKSIFCVAPTSAGKTFISFYAMRKVLEADDDGVLVFIAPTKALVNQIAAEIQARYSKKFKYPGKSVWAIHTRDYRINNCTGCQVLVTVPHVLQIMLLAPSHANSWSNKIKRIIFDEVHSIGNADDGVVWEQLLLLAPCPIIALSATVGNPEEFHEWLSSTQMAIGNEVLLEGTTQRYSDLRKFNYVPPKKFAFGGLGEKSGFSKLGLDGTDGYSFVHPVASLLNRSRGMPDDLSLEPRDCFTLWSSMTKHQTQDFPVPKSLDPNSTALPSLVGKKDTIPWEKGLKDLLRAWMADDKSPFDVVLKELGAPFRHQSRQITQKSSDSLALKVKETRVDAGDLRKTTLPLLCSLNQQGALPAILFNYERGQCESVCLAVTEQLRKAEEAWKETSPKWKAKLKAFEEWKVVQAKAAAKKGKGAKASSKKMSKDDREDAEGDRTSKLDQQKDAGAGEYSEFDAFDPEAPVEGFHFADTKKLALSELEGYIWQLRRKRIPEWLISAITRGVGVHHAGMNRKYRQVVEILFRKGFLRVVVATGTLALGINMPCKTVVFSGDSVFLTALNFRQGAGRAGRRGFDLLGNVVFQDISEAKVCRLLSSRLPDLNGHFPVTTTLTLRLFSLLSESKNSPYAVKAINTLLSQPRLYMGGPAFKDQTLHHLRFSIEYLRRQRLLDSRGATLNFAGLVSHLYYTENSSFAFHALLKEGYFHRLCAGVNGKEQSTVETLMLVMSHLFGRRYCRQSDEEYKETIVKPSSSIVFLPSLPAEAGTILTEHAEETLRVFKAYVATFVEQHIHHADDQLPLTAVKVGASAKTTEGSAETTSKDAEDSDVEEDWDTAEDKLDTTPDNSIAALKNMTLPPTKIRSQLASLSGLADNFASIHDLCRNTRGGVFLEESVIPHVGSYPNELESPLNSYLLDFFKHGDIKTLERANRIRKGDVWFLLNDFSMVLATIITSLMNFMKLKPTSDLDMLDVMGNLDALEEADDDKLAATDADANAAPVVADPMTQPTKPVVSKTKGKKLDSWEDEVPDEPLLTERAKKALEKEDEFVDAAWDGEVGEKGLLNVLKAFQLLHKDFNEKFRAMWA